MKYEVSAGDGVATGMGHHHDFPLVSEPVRAVYLETTYGGREAARLPQTRSTHGKAQPRVERV